MKKKNLRLQAANLIKHIEEKLPATSSKPLTCKQV
jgi:hypothetical protein